MGGIQVGAEVHSLSYSPCHFGKNIDIIMDILITITIHCYNNFGKSIEIKVDIQRSNGRIHSAVISGLNAEVQSVYCGVVRGWGKRRGKRWGLATINSNGV